MSHFKFYSAKYLKENEFGVMELILIITAFNNSTDYYIFSIKNKEKNQDIKIRLPS